MNSMPPLIKRSLTAFVVEVVAHFLLIIAMVFILTLGVLTMYGIERAFPRTTSTVMKALHMQFSRVQPTHKPDPKNNGKGG